MTKFRALPRPLVDGWRNGSLDAYDMAIEHGVSDGGGLPCRYCLEDIPQDREMLTLAHRPFPTLHPYAETGPIFLCAECQRAEDSGSVPPVLASRKEFLIKGYLANDRIAYGTGQIVRTSLMYKAIGEIFVDPDVTYIHVRSSVNNCYICRIDRI